MLDYSKPINSTISAKLFFLDFSGDARLKWEERELARIGSGRRHFHFAWRDAEHAGKVKSVRWTRKKQMQSDLGHVWQGSNSTYFCSTRKLYEEQTPRRVGAV
jgi:hypothetical protein